MTALNKQALLIENGQLVADTLRHLADNEIDSDYFFITSTSENGTEIEHELAITDYALQAAGTVDELVRALEAEQGYREGAFVACNRWHDKFREAEAKLEAAEKRIAELEGLALENIRLKVGISGLIGLGLRYADADVMRLAADAQQSTPTTDGIIENIAAGIGVKGE
ncbi:MAG: hypothetical protein RSD49_18860 [Hafnia sp.]